MDTEIIVKLITAFGAIAVVALTYWFTKQREREAEWRKEKLDHYKEYISALANTIGSHSKSKKAYAIAYNTVGLFASQNVISRLHKYQEITRLPSEQVNLEKHDKLLTELILAIRKDLKLKPEDDESTFSYKMIASYAEDNQ